MYNYTINTPKKLSFLKNKVKKVDIIKKNVVIVVEGYTDIQKIKTIYPEINCIQTNGLSLKEKNLKLIKDLSINNEIIIFTDPDGPGIKIREKLNDLLQGKCKNAFISKKNISGSKIGIAEAKEEDIKQALNNLVIFDKNNFSLSWEDYLENDFYISNNRKKIANTFNWNEKINSKTLFKWLNYLGLDLIKIKKILENSNES